MRRLSAILVSLLVLLGGASVGWALAAEPGAPERECYVVATSHLDTQWRWTIRQTIEAYIPATLGDNFSLLERYPGYLFSFEGAFRYMLMAEYYPDEYARLRDWVRTGRWRVAGSWVDAVDVNMPSPESLVRHALYGNGFFRSEFGVTSHDVFLPDCFGFGYALPAIARHCGVGGFSTQKLTWGSAYGVPFDVGLWEGVDGSQLIAALQPGSYVSRLAVDLSADSTLAAAIDRQGAVSGLHATVRYFGTGDQGGAPAESSVIWLERSLAGAGPVRVRAAASDQLARDIEARLAQPAGGGLTLPRYRGELLMTDHGAGCYTSQAEMKRLNRRNELLADAAERAAVAAHWLGAMPYPHQTLREAWVRFLWHQFHDDLTGTSIPEAYVHSWNDEAIAADQFTAILDAAVGAVSRGLDTRAEGVPVVVYNPLAVPRAEVVEARLRFPGVAPRAVRVFGPQGDETAAQVVRAAGEELIVLFVAVVSPTGFAVYDVRPERSRRPIAAPAGITGPTADGSFELFNDRYAVTLDAGGCVRAITDRRTGRVLTGGPLRLEMLDDEPAEWAAWEIDFADIMAPPRRIVGGDAAGPSRPRVVETGPVRASVEVACEADGSTFVLRYSLSAGQNGDWLEVAADIDWRTPGTLLKAAFPLDAKAADATYGLGLGTISRGVNAPNLYEVPAQQWADLSDRDGAFGVALLADGKYGWDRPDSSTLRLTLLHTPRVNARWRWVGDQGSQDLGRHRMRWAIAGHAGDWRTGAAPWLADRFAQPLCAYQVPAHRGRLGRDFSLLRVGNGSAFRAADASPPVAVRALKLADQSDEIVVRLAELLGEDASGVRVSFAAPVVAVREVDGTEQPWRDPPAGLASPRGLFAAADGGLVCDMAPYQLRAFAVRLGPPRVRLAQTQAEPLELPWNLDGISGNVDRGDGDFDGEGRTLADELLPREFMREGIAFATGPRDPGKANVVACTGQRLRIPQGYWNRLYVLAAAVGGDREAFFKVDGHPHAVWVQDWCEPIAQWDSRLVAGSFVTKGVGLAVNNGTAANNAVSSAASSAAIAAIVPGYRKPARLGWVGNHRHLPQGDDAYALTHLFQYRLDLPPGSRWLELPSEPNVRIVAITVARNENDEAIAATPVSPPLPAAVVIDAPRRVFIDSLQVALRSPVPGAVIRYTLDGSEPTGAAPYYRGPFTLTADATLRARAFAPFETAETGAAPVEATGRPFIATATFAKLAPRAATSGVADLQPGLACRYFEGRWDRLPDFAALAPLREEVVGEIGLPPFARDEEFGLELSGYLVVPRTGVYTLSLRTDDGSALYLGGKRIIDSDGLHGKEDQRAEVALAAGPHALRLVYFQRGGDAACELWIDGPGAPMQPVPAAMLSHGSELGR